jgi:histidine triad (HIT) family protein
MDCLFCEIIKKKKAYIVAENEEALAILDIYPVSDGHTLLVTKRHFANIAEVDEKGWECLLPLMKLVIGKLQAVFQPAGFNIISNMNEIASQSVFHLHIHIIPKYKKNKGFIWAPDPELKHDLDQVAKKLK